MGVEAESASCDEVDVLGGHVQGGRSLGWKGDRRGEIRWARGSGKVGLTRCEEGFLGLDQPVPVDGH